MTTLLHAAAGLDALTAALTTAWAAAGEILTAGALLWTLNALASAMRTTYRAGRIVGTAWYAYGQPALLAAADAVSWLIAQVDWAEVAATLAATARTLLALAITAATITTEQARLMHRDWVGSIDWTPAAPAALPALPAAPEPAPIAPAAPAATAAPKRLTVVQLRKKARSLGHTHAGSRRIAQARRADLEALLAA